MSKKRAKNTLLAELMEQDWVPYRSRDREQNEDKHKYLFTKNNGNLMVKVELLLESAASKKHMVLDALSNFRIKRYYTRQNPQSDVRSTLFTSIHIDVYRTRDDKRIKEFIVQTDSVDFPKEILNLLYKQPDIYFNYILVMPSYKQDLYSYIKQNNRRNIGELIQQIVMGLYDLHEKIFVVHLDIKPMNIFVSENGDLFYGDFGFSIPFEQFRDKSYRVFGVNDPAFIFEHHQVNTIDYAPCEFLEDRYVQVKSSMKEQFESLKKADIYALGITLLEVIYGVEDVSLFGILDWEEINHWKDAGENILEMQQALLEVLLPFIHDTLTEDNTYWVVLESKWSDYKKRNKKFLDKHRERYQSGPSFVKYIYDHMLTSDLIERHSIVQILQTVEEKFK